MTVKAKVDEEFYKKCIRAMRIAYEAVAQDMPSQDLSDFNIMFEVTTDADRMHLFDSEFTYEDQQRYYALPRSVKRGMFKDVY